MVADRRANSRRLANDYRVVAERGALISTKATALAESLGRWSSAVMCNNYQFYLEYEACRLMQEIELGIPTQQSELDMPPAEDVRINDVAPRHAHQGQCGRAGADAVELPRLTARRAAGVQFPGRGPQVPEG